MCARMIAADVRCNMPVQRAEVPHRILDLGELEVLRVFHAGQAGNVNRTMPENGTRARRPMKLSSSIEYGATSFDG